MFENVSLCSSFYWLAPVQYSLLLTFLLFVCSWFLPSLRCLSLWHLHPPPASPWPPSVLFDINIVLGWPDGVEFRCGAVARSALLLPGYKQVSCGPWWAISSAHMLIERIRQPWCPQHPPSPLPC